MAPKHVQRPIMDEDSIDLAALRFVLREAEIRMRETCEADLPRDVQQAQDQKCDERAQKHVGAIAARDRLRFDGETSASPEHRAAKHRHYSMYALHPDTAEQIMKALEAIMESVGPRYRIPTRPRTFSAKTVRNSNLRQTEGKSE